VVRKRDQEPTHFRSGLAGEGSDGLGEQRRARGPVSGWVHQQDQFVAGQQDYRCLAAESSATHNHAGSVGHLANRTDGNRGNDRSGHHLPIPCHVVLLDQSVARVDSSGSVAYQ